MAELVEPVAVAGNCHRVALAVEDLPAASRWFQEVLGATAMPIGESGNGAVEAEGDGGLLAILWLQNVPIVLLAATDPEGTIGRFLATNGPSVQSLAWEIPDMWRTENLLRADGNAIVGVDIPGRHFFVHPRDTLGLLLEYTDDKLPGDPRHGAPTLLGDGLLPVTSVAWVTAVADDLDATVERLRYLFSPGSVEPQPLATGDPAVVLRIGDMSVRLVAPAAEASPYARPPRTSRYHSMALAVSDFATLDERLAGAGIGVQSREPGAVWTDPADTLGVRLQFVDAAALAS
jgi:catechol 2,3-dioxygenase-like lactoylglutathione lyase family enzyme